MRKMILFFLTAAFVSALLPARVQATGNGDSGGPSGNGAAGGTNASQTSTSQSFGGALLESGSIAWKNNAGDYFEKSTKVLSQVAQDKGHKFTGKILDNAGNVFNIANTIQDISEYNNPSNHKHSSLKFIDQTLRGSSIAVQLLGKQFPKFDKVIGVTKDLFGSEMVSGYFNRIKKGENSVLDAMDSSIDNMNTGVQDFYAWFFDVTGLPIPGLDGEVDILKPNLYLYSETPAEVTVTFPRAHLLTASIPDYKNGWTVRTSGSGTLTDQNGSYGFLFYESKSSASDFQARAGFSLGAADRARQMGAILDLYGFNHTEKADFIEFWMEKLDPDQVYAMYPQDTKRLNSVMPLSVSPAPDHVFRLWFGFEATDKTPELPDIERIDRGGLSVVEWGGYVDSPVYIGYNGQ